jgi:hypothetical protein
MQLSGQTLLQRSQGSRAVAVGLHHLVGGFGKLPSRNKSI